MQLFHRVRRAQRFNAGLGLAVALLALPAAASPPPLPLRSPAAFAEALARYDAAPVGPVRDALALAVDRAAAQRYATVSRLYWYTDLTEAEAAAQAAHKPILALRMLGRLDEDLSCANSRFFRATLYANARLSTYLRAHFILYWSSERPVPVVTIDYGDGRKLVRTTTGNSAHYVLDERGNVLDVLPGLYAPRIFEQELAKSLDLADRVRPMADAERTKAVLDYHAYWALDAQRHYGMASIGASVAPADHLLTDAERAAADSLAAAQRGTVSKMAVEVRDLRRTGMLPDEPSRWAAIGQAAFKITGTAPTVLDAQSRALVERLHNAGPITANPTDTARVIARYEQRVVADTAQNEFRLRQDIRRMIARERVLDFERLNARIYDAIFSTPRSDAWLGLLPRTEFSGLPGDGVVLP